MKNIFIFLVNIYFFSITIHAQNAGNPPSQVAAQTPEEKLYDEGLALKKQDKIIEAYNKFKKATELKPGYTDAWYEMGWCMNDLKDYKEALRVLRKTMPAMKDVYRANFELAYAFEMSDTYDSAVYYYNRAQAIAPQNSGVYKRLGYIAYQKSDNEGTLEQFAKFEKAVKDPVTDYLYWYRKGFTQNAMKDYSAAKISLNKSLEFKTDYINTYLELGFSSSRLKENDEAIRFYQKAIDMDPKNHVGYNGIAEVYRDNIKDLDMAMSWYQKTLGIKPNERKANFGIGYCLNSKKRYGEAIPYLKKAIEMEDTYTAAYVELGYSYYKTANYPDALTHFRKAIDLNPMNENARYYMGLVYVTQKDKTNAQRMVTELKSLNSKNAASLESLVNKM